MEHWLGLTTVTRLLAIVSALSLCEEGGLCLERVRDAENWSAVIATHLASLVLCDFVVGMLLAVFALAVGSSCLWNVDLRGFTSASAYLEPNKNLSAP